MPKTAEDFLKGGDTTQSAEDFLKSEPQNKSAETFLKEGDSKDSPTLYGISGKQGLENRSNAPNVSREPVGEGMLSEFGWDQDAFMQSWSDIGTMLKHPYSIVEGATEFTTALPAFTIGIMNAGRRMAATAPGSNVQNMDDLYEQGKKGFKEGFKVAEPLIYHSGKIAPKRGAKTAQSIAMAPAEGVIMAGHKLANSKTFKDNPNIRGALKLGSDIAGLYAQGMLMKGGRKSSAETSRSIAERASEIDAMERGKPPHKLLAESNKRKAEIRLRKAREEKARLEKDVQKQTEFIKDTYSGKNPGESAKVEAEIKRLSGLDKAKERVSKQEAELAHAARELTKKEQEQAKNTAQSFETTTAAESGATHQAAVKTGDAQTARAMLEREARQTLTGEDANILDTAAGNYFRNNNSIAAYLESMTDLGELSIKEVDRAMQGEAARASRRLNKKAEPPAIRKSGFYAQQKFADEISGAADVGKQEKMWTDPTRTIQSVDQGMFGGPVQRNVLWPTRRNTLAKLSFADQYKRRIDNEIVSAYGVKNKAKAEATGRIAQSINSSDIKADPLELMKRKGIKTVLGEKKQAKLPANEQINLIRAAQKSREIFDELINVQNIAREKRKQNQIPYRQNYIPHIQESLVKQEWLGIKRNGRDLIEKPEMPDFLQIDKPFNAREQARRYGLDNHMRQNNIVRLLADYTDTAARDVFDTNTVHNNRIHSKVMRYKGLDNAADAIETWTAESFAGTKPRFSKWWAETLPNPAQKAVAGIRRGLTGAVFPLNWTWNTFVQTSSAGLTFSKYGGVNSVKGLRPLFDPEFRQAVRRNSYSKIMKERRAGSVSFQDIAQGIERNARLQQGKIETAEQYANFFTTAVENALTQHAIASAYYDGKAKGLTGRQLWEYASEGGAKTQSMYNMSDLPGLLRSREIASIAPFQTFCFEVMNTIRETDVPILRNVRGSRTGAYKTLNANTAAGEALLSQRLAKLGRWAAAITVTDAVADKAIGRKPWTPTSFVPFFNIITSGEQHRPAGVWRQYQQELKKGISDAVWKDDYSRLRDTIARYHVPGGVQLSRTLSGIEAAANDEVTDVSGREMFEVEGAMEDLRAISMGPWRTRAGIEYKKEHFPDLIDRMIKYAQEPEEKAWSSSDRDSGDTWND